jgi:hypothetical protein
MSAEIVEKEILAGETWDSRFIDLTIRPMLAIT